jgi:hypothetical protein
LADERKYKRLSEEENQRVIAEFKNIVQEGLLSPKLHDSLIGLSADDITVEWPGRTKGQADSLGLRVPPEVISHAFNGIDAYVTALLATETQIFEGCTLTGHCRLEKQHESLLNIRFYATTDVLIPELWGTRLLQMLHTVSPVMAVKGITNLGAVFADKARAPIWFAWPGQMILAKSTLAALSPDLWPVMSRSIKVTGEIRSRARNAVDLLVNPGAGHIVEPN